MLELSLTVTILSLILLALDYFGITGKTPEYTEEIGEDLESWINDNNKLISLDIFNPNYWDGFEDHDIEVQSNLSVIAFERNMVA